MNWCDVNRQVVNEILFHIENCDLQQFARYYRFCERKCRSYNTYICLMIYTWKSRWYVRLYFTPQCMRVMFVCNLSFSEMLSFLQVTRLHSKRKLCKTSIIWYVFIWLYGFMWKLHIALNIFSAQSLHSGDADITLIDKIRPLCGDVRLCKYHNCYLSTM